MNLTKDGVTFNVESPIDIARLKRAGYVEEKPAEKPVANGETASATPRSDAEKKVKNGA